MKIFEVVAKITKDVDPETGEVILKMLMLEQI